MRCRQECVGPHPTKEVVVVIAPNLDIFFRVGEVVPSRLLVKPVQYSNQILAATCSESRCGE